MKLPSKAAVIGMAVLALSVSNLAAQDTSSESESFSEKISSTLVSIQQYAVEQKDQAYQSGQEALDTIDSHLQSLQEKAAEAGDDAQSQFAIEYAKLEGLRAQAGDSLDNLSDSASDQWEHSKRDFSDVVTEIQNSVERAYNDLTTQE